MTRRPSFFQLRLAFRLEILFARAVAAGFTGDKQAWINTYPSMKY